MIRKQYVIDNQESVVTIGYNILDKVLEEIEEIYADSKLFFIVSNSVYPYIKNNLEYVSNKHHIQKIDDGEHCKSFSNLEALCENILLHEIDRESTIVVIGGGTIIDLASLAAHMILRGIKLVHIPTTLIAQSDGAIGGKNAINSKYGKNLIGTFYLADRIYCDIKFFQYLNQRQYSSGYAEILKYALICDKDFYKYLLDNHQKLIQRKNDYLLNIIEKSIAHKAAIVKVDFFDKSKRRILNFGHTFGHALEKASGYSLLHGEAIAIGMFIACEFSKYLGADISCEEIDILRNHIKSCGLSTNIPEDISVDKIIELMHKDKKNLNNKISLVLLNKVGSAYFNRDTDIYELKKFLDEQCYSYME